MRRLIAASLLALFGAWAAACGAFSLSSVADGGPEATTGDEAHSGDSGGPSDSSPPTTDVSDASCVPDGAPCSCLQTPTLLTPGPDSVAAMAVLDGLVYWISPYGSGTALAYVLTTTSVEAGTPTPYATMSYQQDDQLPGSGGHFYVGSLKGVTALQMVPEAGAETVVTTALSANGVVVGPGGIYWTNQLAEVCHSPFGAIPATSTDASCGGPPLVAAVIGGAGPTTNRLAINSTSVYLAVTELGQIRMTPIGGGKTQVIARGSTGERFIFASDDDLVWSYSSNSKDSGTLNRSGPDGKDAAVLATTEPIQSVLVEPGFIYFSTTSGSGGRILRIPRDGGPTTVLACDEFHQPLAIAVDSESLYWGDKDTAGIWKVPLPHP
jgi:hypothetical protein